MTGSTGEPLDGGMTVDLATARVLLRYHEAVAQAAEAACLELYDLGVQRPVDLLLGRRPPRKPVPA